MNLSIGIVGLPNVGKSTLFQAITQKEVEIANYPFATIDPNVGIVKVPDARLDKLAELFRSEEKIPAIVEFVDIAGLVKGAHEGEGLGNQFLAHIREVAAICHVVRDFEDTDIHHVAGTVEPVRDVETIETELLLKDLETVEKRFQAVEREARSGDKEAAASLSFLRELKAHFDKGLPAREFGESEAGELLRELHLLTAKPVIFLVNTKEERISEGLAKAIDERGGAAVAMNLKEELEAAQLSRQEAQELGIVSKLTDLIRASYEMLDVITFFTAGEKETRAWQVRRGAKAPEAGAAIHSDFAEKFIKAQVISWDKLLEAGGYARAAARGWLRTEGKEYAVQDGDVIEIKHGS